MGIRNTGLVLAAFGVLAFSPALASPESDELSRDGLRQLQAGDRQAAVRSFVEATQADPKDGRAFFYLGVGLNRTGQPHEALAAFRQAITLKAIHKDLGFEGGWAALEAGDYGSAAVMLGGFLELNRNHAKAHEFLGRTYFNLGQFEPAEGLLRKAMELDPALKPSVLAVLASIEVARGENRAAGENIAEILNDESDNPIRRQFIEALRPVQQPQPASKAWTVFGSTAIGRNSNVIALSDQIVQPADITRIDSKYFDISAGGNYRLRIDADKAVTVGGTLSHRNYRDIKNKDTHAANFFARYDQVVTDRLLASLTGTFGHTRVDGDAFQNTVGISPSLRYLINDRVRFQLTYSATKINLPEPTATPASLDRDSKLQTLGGNMTIAFPDFETDLIFGGAVLLNSAAGGDYDYRARRFNIGARTQLPYDVVAGLGWTHTEYDYLNLNSLAPTNPPGATAFGFAREDAINTLSANLERPISDRASAFARFTKTVASSNLAVFDYDQKDFQVGVTASF